MKNIIFIAFVFSAALGSACTTANAPGGNSNSVTNVNMTNIPPEFSNKSLTPGGNSTPGISGPNAANLSNLPKGATPTPGIPDAKNINKPVPKGATPTPGIPDPETIKKQMNRIYDDADVVNQVPKDADRLDKIYQERRKKLLKKPQ